MSAYRELTLRGAQNGALRTAVFRQREHIVVPVVALVQGVVHAVNSPTPELVLASEFGHAPDAWNGEPVMLNHPSIDGFMVSANQPEVLEQWQLGHVFHSKIEGERLLMEAYIDLNRVDDVGEQAQQLLETLRSGGLVEVSVGAFITAERAEGTYNGKPYKAIWRNVMPDHLALLPEGYVGACSNQAGCGAGAPRAASSCVHLITAEGIRREDEVSQTSGDKPADAPETPTRSLRQRVTDMIKSLSNGTSTVTAAADAPSGPSDADLRRLLDEKLRSTEPAYLGIDAVFPEDNLVIYAVSPENGFQVFQRSYTLTDGAVEIGGERVEVEPVMRYEPVAAATASEQRAACGCHNSTTSASESAPVQGERLVHKNAERITALIANPNTPWTEADRAYLETVEDGRIATLEAAAAPKEPAKPEVKIEDLPEPWRKAIEAQAASQAAEQNTVIETLASSQTVFTKDELKAMPFEQVKKMATLAGVQQQATQQPVVQQPTSFAGLSAVPPVAGNNAAPAPPDMNAAIRAARAK